MSRTSHYYQIIRHEILARVSQKKFVERKDSHSYLAARQAFLGHPNKITVEGAW